MRPWQLDELEDHLLTTLDRTREEFPSEAHAWKAAMERTGSVPLITREFAKEHVMNPLSKLAGVGVTLGLLWLVIATGPGAASFLHLPSLLFVLAFVVGGLVASFGPGQVRRALSASLRGTSPLECAEVESLTAVFQRGYRLAWMAGLVGCISGLIQMLANLSDPSMVGVGVATCTLSIFYGALLAEVLFANGRQWLAARARVSP